jgi:Hemerythrin HHE cation binding domain
MEATALVRGQHRSLEHLLARIRCQKALRPGLVYRLVEELMTHMALEDRFLLGELGARTAVRIEPYRDDQACVRNAMLQAVFAEAEEGRFADRLRDLAIAFETHTHVLERGLLPLVESALGADELKALGDRMQTFWHAALGHRGPSAEPHVHAAE